MCEREFKEKLIGLIDDYYDNEFKKTFGYERVSLWGFKLWLEESLKEKQ